MTNYHITSRHSEKAISEDKPLRLYALSQLYRLGRSDRIFV
ncbi:hypothetical protein [Nostoc sp.]